MRVIAGIYKGRRLKTIDGLHVRPTSDRLRETLFNVLAPRIEDTRVLDLCAGSGAVGIEALSRGAAHVTFVEYARRAVTVIYENLRHCGISEDFTVLNRDVLTALKQLATRKEQFDICYFDPPYESEVYSPTLHQIVRQNLLAENGLVIVEHRRQSPLAPNYEQLRPYREIVQGESCLTFYRLEPEQTEACPTPSAEESLS